MHTTASKRPRSSVRRSATAVRTGSLRAAASREQRATAPGLRSDAVTAKPARASPSACVPMPQAASRTVSRIAQERGQHLGLTVDRALPVLEDQVVVRRQIVVEGVRLHVRNRTRVGTRLGVRRIIPAAALVIAACLATAGSAAAQSGACPKLSQPWYGSNAQRIQTVIDARGTCSGLPGGRPLAVFDWDNTIIKNDISDQTFFWMLRHDKVRQPAGRDWTTTSTYMTRAGARALRRACGSLADPGRAAADQHEHALRRRARLVPQGRGDDGRRRRVRRLQPSPHGGRVHLDVPAHGRAHAGDRACMGARRAQARARPPAGRDAEGRLGP